MLCQLCKSKCDVVPVESRLTAGENVWSLTAADRSPIEVEQKDKLIADCLRALSPPFFGHYWLTEKEAIDAARQYAKEREAFWYARIRTLDARIDEIDTAEFEESNAI